MEPRTRLKTFSHLYSLKKIPSEYELTTTQLDYYNNKSFEIKTPLQKWFEQYQHNSQLTLPSTQIQMRRDVEIEFMDHIDNSYSIESFKSAKADCT